MNLNSIRSTKFDIDYYSDSLKLDSDPSKTSNFHGFLILVACPNGGLIQKKCRWQFLILHGIDHFLSGHYVFKKK